SSARSFFAVHRGDFIKAIARAWFRGVPIDPQYAALTGQDATRMSLREEIIGSLSDKFPVWDGLTLKNAKLGQASRSLDTRCPGLRSPGDLLLSKPNCAASSALPVPSWSWSTACTHSASCKTLRTWFAPFWTATSRVAPSTNSYIFNLPAWLRGAMAPPEGYAIVYADWSAMEFGIAGARSGDATMKEFYHAPCPYIACSVAFGLLPG